jgi:hypothetical protein
LRCIVVDNFCFSMLPIKVSATMPVQGAQGICQCNANWAGRRTATCCLLAENPLSCQLSGSSRGSELPCWNATQPCGGMLLSDKTESCLEVNEIQKFSFRSEYYKMYD